MRTAKASSIKESGVTVCSVCMASYPHTMRYQISECASLSCQAATTPDKLCPWKCKVLTCQIFGLVSIYTVAEHLDPGSDLSTSRANRLTEEHNDLTRSLARYGLQPRSILDQQQADADPREAPGLMQSQSYMGHHPMSNSGDKDFIALIEAQVNAAVFTGQEEESQPFYFSIPSGGDVPPHAANAFDSNPLVVGVSTKMLLRRMDRDPESFVFHLYTTFELNKAGFPVLVCGISDADRRFHLVALFVMSEAKARHYMAALTSLQQIYTQVTTKRLVLRYVMGDANAAQFDALLVVFGCCEYIMCFYDVLTDLVEHSGSVPEAKASLMLADVYSLHSARSPGEFLTEKMAAVIRWRADPDVASFGEYICQQWLTGKFAAWQCFRSPIGFATTNHAVAKFAKSIGMGRRQFLMGPLLLNLSGCCQREAIKAEPFATKTRASTKLRSRATDLRRKKYTIEVPEFDETGEKIPSSLMVVRTAALLQAETAQGLDLNVQLKANNVRLERDAQPQVGWPVDLDKHECPCKYFFKYGHCVHLLFALYVQCGHDNPPGRMMFDRSKRAKKRAFWEMAAVPP